MFSPSRRGWLPVHVALRKEAAELARPGAGWLLERMFDADPFHPGARPPSPSPSPGPKPSPSPSPHRGALTLTVGL